MAEEQKKVEVSETANQNAAAEQDVQNVLAELKGEEQEKKPEAEKKEGDAEAAEEAKIIAAAAKLGQEAVSKESKESEARNDEGDRKPRVNYRENIKSDFTHLEETSDPKEIRKQVEFYFSDSNLPMDKFLLSKVGGKENRAVELSLLHSFKRMRRFQPFSAIVDALKDSESLQLVNDNTCVKRKVPLPDSVTESANYNVVKVFEDKAMHRSIYAKGFGQEEPGTQFDIEAFFAQYGPTNAVRLRRTSDKIFKGSVFVEFDTEEAAKAFLALDPKPKWKGTSELLIKSKKDYCDEKVKEIEAGRVKPQNGRGRGGRGRGRGRGGSDNRDWRERRSDDQKRGFRGGRGGGHRGRGGFKPENGRQEPEKDARGVPVIQVGKGDAPAGAGQKRSRDEDAPADAGKPAEPPAKKVDAKEG